MAHAEVEARAVPRAEGDRLHQDSVIADRAGGSFICGRTSCSRVTGWNGPLSDALLELPASPWCARLRCQRHKVGLTCQNPAACSLVAQEACMRKKCTSATTSQMPAVLRPPGVRRMPFAEDNTTTRCGKTSRHARLQAEIAAGSLDSRGSAGDNRCQATTGTTIDPKVYPSRDIGRLQHLRSPVPHQGIALWVKSIAFECALGWRPVVGAVLLKMLMLAAKSALLAPPAAVSGLVGMTLTAPAEAAQELNSSSKARERREGQLSAAAQPGHVGTCHCTGTCRQAGQRCRICPRVP